MGHLGDGEIAAFVEGSIGEAQAERVREHLDGCDDCRLAVLGLARRSGPGRGPSASVTGTRLGPFVIGERLGEGGMGVVYRARDTRLDRDVAIKLLHADGPAASERLLAEARAMARVEDPAVLRVYEIAEHEGVVVVVMELVPGGLTLGALLRRERAAPGRVRRLYARAAAGLAAAHAQGLVHRDFKPDNVLVEERGERVLVADFGLAALAGESGLARGSPGGGTPAYMAPEQIDGGAVGPAADVFALAVSVWEALAGEGPFGSGSLSERRQAMERGPRGRPAAPRALVRLLGRALAVDPALRPPIAQVIAALEPRPARRIVGLAALVLAAAGVVALVALRPAAGDDGLAGCLAPPPWAARLATWRSEALGAGVPSWVIARVSARFTSRARDLSALGKGFCPRAESSARRAFVACREQQTIEERETLAALSRPWPSYDRLDEALALGWASTCASKAAGFILVSEPSGAGERRALAEGRALLARARLAGLAGQPFAPLLERVANGPARELLGSGLLLTRLQLEAWPDRAERRRALERAVELAERRADLHGAAVAWLYLAQRLAELDEPPDAVAQAFRQADWAIERVGDPPALRAAWHGGLAVQAQRQGDVAAASQHAQAAEAIAAADPAAVEDALYARQAAAQIAGDASTQRQVAERLIAAHGGRPTLELANHHATLAEALDQLGELAPARQAIARALALCEELGLEATPEYGRFLLIRAGLELEAGEAKASLASMQVAEATFTRTLPADHLMFAALIFRRSLALMAVGDVPGALAAAEESARRYLVARGPGSEELLAAQAQLAEIAATQGDLARAERVGREVLEATRTRFGADSERAASVEGELSPWLASQGKTAEAEALLEHAVKVLATSPDRAYAAQSSLALAELVLARDPARALTLAGEGLAVWQGQDYWAEELARAQRVTDQARRRLRR